MSNRMRQALGPRKVSFTWEHDTESGSGQFSLLGVKTVEEWRLVMHEIANSAKSCADNLSDELIQQSLDAP